MNNNIYTETQTGLNRFFARVYGLVGMGILLSAIVSAGMLYIFTDTFVDILINQPMIYFGAMAVELVLVFWAASVARQNSPLALPLFLIYSALNGFTLSFIIAQYAQTTVVAAFVSSSILFFVMAIIGRVTKKDLSGMGKALIAALIGLIITSIVNMFLASGPLSLMISMVSVVIFSGLIAYDNQRIKRVYEESNGQVLDGWAVSLALSLYLDFINLFISLLRIFGRRR
ncbi:Bax inhibitor-1/YccA family protein [Streptococcus zalophi]|uniref:Bax inhibitor-1/YccA family protein n=1 Tax=Streptococcus zalophi TaxID=640031 RepID=A0A934P9P9_9STRE|nr:Bax inhibitor-1/YccA family protein [Streptococcus zalophi]MBJ8349751.1 Bax inhibitor-1/YccA family protein [Streptococcus zalophi]MCR8967903.1 Bax inhibitor-1/YccA family protein [Streptococcus zalophi]